MPYIREQMRVYPASGKACRYYVRKCNAWVRISFSTYQANAIESSGMDTFSTHTAADGTRREYRTLRFNSLNITI